jgi:hypothetical protein
MSNFKRLLGLFIGTASGVYLTFEYIAGKDSAGLFFLSIIFVFSPCIILIHLTIMYVFNKLISSTKGMFFVSSTISISYGVGISYFLHRSFKHIYQDDLSMVLSFACIGLGYFSVYAMQKQWAFTEANKTPK